jgi:hypothetical protein
MSIEEIRTQKALALLEHQEAEDEVTRLNKARGSLVAKASQLAIAIDRVADGTLLLPELVHDFEDLTMQRIQATLIELAEARERLTLAIKKKRQFGLPV